MVVVEIDGDRRAIARLDRAIEAVGNPRAAMEGIGDIMLKEIDGNFEEEGARLNPSEWVPLAQPTLRQKKREGYGDKGILERTGELRESFGKGVTDFAVRVSSDAGIYPYHQLGLGFNPRRRMLAFSERMKQEIIGEFARFIANALRGANR